ncbi:MAG: hypothetical protein KAS32_28775 [Candidatus Peribacteraceae bacterium]|nr:hypothetical protein [Candidatus Peribacteraceae bacterium]
MKMVVTAIILIVFFVVVVGLLTVWSGQSNDTVNGVMDFLKGLSPSGTSGTSGTTTPAPPGTTPGVAASTIAGSPIAKTII